MTLDEKNKGTIDLEHSTAVVWILCIEPKGNYVHTYSRASLTTKGTDMAR